MHLRRPSLASFRIQRIEKKNSFFRTEVPFPVALNSQSRVLEFVSFSVNIIDITGNKPCQFKDLIGCQVLSDDNSTQLILKASSSLIKYDKEHPYECPQPYSFRSCATYMYFLKKTLALSLWDGVGLPLWKLFSAYIQMVPSLLSCRCQLNTCLFPGLLVNGGF